MLRLRTRRWTPKQIPHCLLHCLGERITLIREVSSREFYNPLLLLQTPKYNRMEETTKLIYRVLEDDSQPSSLEVRWQNSCSLDFIELGTVACMSMH